MYGMAECSKSRDATIPEAIGQTNQTEEHFHAQEAHDLDWHAASVSGPRSHSRACKWTVCLCNGDDSESLFSKLYVHKQHLARQQ